MKPPVPCGRSRDHLAPVSTWQQATLSTQATSGFALDGSALEVLEAAFARDRCGTARSRPCARPRRKVRGRLNERADEEHARDPAKDGMLDSSTFQTYAACSTSRSRRSSPNAGRTGRRMIVKQLRTPQPSIPLACPRAARRDATSTGTPGCSATAAAGTASASATDAAREARRGHNANFGARTLERRQAAEEATACRRNSFSARRH